MAEPEYVTVFTKNYSDTVSKNFKCFLDDDIYIDLIFMCKNNEKVGAHQIVMGCISRFFYSMFIENLNTVKEKIMYVYVPDIKAKIMKRILEFVYCGKAMLSQNELNEFNSNIKLLGMPLDLFTSDNKSNSSQKSANTAENVINSTCKKSVIASNEVPKNITCVPEVRNEPSLNSVQPSQSCTNPVVKVDEEIVTSSNSSAILRPTTGPDIHPSPASNTPNVTNVHEIPPSPNINRTIPGTEFSWSSTLSGTECSPNLSLPPEPRTIEPLKPGGRPQKRKLDTPDVGLCINLDSDGEDDVITIS